MAKNRKQKKPKKHPKFWLGFKIFILLILVTILVGGIVFYFKYGRDIFAMQDEAVQMVSASTEETFRDSETTIAYNAKGKQIAVLKGYGAVQLFDACAFQRWQYFKRESCLLVAVYQVDNSHFFFVVFVR